MWARNNGNRSIAFVDATETKYLIMIRARKGASFSLRSKENFGRTKKSIDKSNEIIIGYDIIFQCGTFRGIRTASRAGHRTRLPKERPTAAEFFKSSVSGVGAVTDPTREHHLWVFFVGWVTAPACKKNG